MRHVLAVTLLGAVLAMGGCFALSVKDNSVKNNPTLGQQLMDLQAAKKSGAMTEEEYQKARTKLLADQPVGNPPCAPTTETK